MKVDKLLTGQSGIRNVEEAFDHVHIKGKTPIDMSKLNKSTVYKLEKRGLTMGEELDKTGVDRLTKPNGPVGTLQESISKSGTNLSDEMARYNDYWKRVKTGETGHPGMSHEEYLKWGYGDSKVREQLAFNRFLEGAREADFTGKLRGKNITLKDMKTKKISYVKRETVELNKLRKYFNTTGRKKFWNIYLKMLSI